MKRVLILVPTLQLGGSERTAVNTANILSKENDVFFAVFDGDKAVYKPECNVIDLKYPALSGKMKKAFQVLRRKRAVNKLEKNNNIDVCISFGPTANLVNAATGKKCKRLVSLRGYASAGGSKKSLYTYRNSDAILCCSKEIKQKIDGKVPDLSYKTFVIYNPFDIEKIKKAALEPVTDFDFSKTTIVTHGRLNEVKNHYRLIKAFSLIHDKYPETQLLIIGEGEMHGELAELAERHGVRESVFLIGFRENPFKYLARSSLYVLSSFSEGFPNALAEGMIFLPAVSVDCPSGPCEIFRSSDDLTHTDGIEEAEYGILVRPASSRSNAVELTEDDRILADAINLMLSDKEKMSAYREKASRRVAEFSLEQYRANLNEIIERSNK